MAAETRGEPMRHADPAGRFGRGAVTTVEVDHCTIVGHIRRGGQSNVEAKVRARAAGLQRAGAVVRRNQQFDCHGWSGTVHTADATFRGMAWSLANTRELNVDSNSASLRFIIVTALIGTPSISAESALFNGLPEVLRMSNLDVGFGA